MFDGWLFSSTGVVGLDFGTSGVKMLQVRMHPPKSGKLQVVGAALVEIPLTAVTNSPQPAPQAAKSAIANPLIQAPKAVGGGGAVDAMNAEMAPKIARVAEQLRSAFMVGGFTGRRCVVSLAREDVCLQSVRLPRMPDDEMRQSVQWEAAQRFGFDRNAMQVDFIRTGGTPTTGGQAAETREEVIILAASHAAINARLEPVLQAGLRPIAVETGFSGLARLFSRLLRRDEDQDSVRAVVEVGWSGSTVLLLRGMQIALCKPIAIGGVHLNRAVAEHLQIPEKAAADLRASRIAAGAPVLRTGSPPSPHSQASNLDPATDRAVYEAVRPLMGELVKEVMLCLRYFGVTFRGQPPKRIALTGGDGLEPHLDTMMSQTCKAHVCYDDDADTLASLSGQIRASLNRTPGPAAAWATAAGLSLRGLVGQKSEVRSQSSEMSSLTSDNRPLTSEPGRAAA